MKKITTISTPIEYEILSERPYLILKRKKSNGRTAACPFCGARHLHGSLDGHRVGHCATGSKESVAADDGTILYQKDGYILETFNRTIKTKK